MDRGPVMHYIVVERSVQPVRRDVLVDQLEQCGRRGADLTRGGGRDVQRPEDLGAVDVPDAQPVPPGSRELGDEAEAQPGAYVVRGRRDVGDLDVSR